MNYGEYDTICCKRSFYLLICNELTCIDQGNQLLIITKTINIFTILQPLNFNIFLHGYCLQCIIYKNEVDAFQEFYKTTKNYKWMFYNGITS